MPAADKIGLLEHTMQKVIAAEEADLLRKTEELVGRVIAVDHFDPASVRPHYQNTGVTSVHIAAE